MTDQPNREPHRLDSGQPHLDIVGEGDSRDVTSQEGIRYALLTNRNNLLEILSSGLVKPASLYTKYYPDLGAMYPEAVPLLVRDPSSTLVNSMGGEDSGAFPVLLDVDLEDMTGMVQAVLADEYRVERVEMPLREDAVCFLADGVLPATRVNAVHFRSEQELQEHTARIYENVRNSVVPLQVSPERFRGHRMNVRRMLSALNRTQQTTAALQPERLARADALGGALLMLAALAEQDGRFPLAALTRPLELLRAPTDPPGVLEKNADHPTLDRRLVTMAAALLADTDAPGFGVPADNLSSGEKDLQDQADPVADLLLMVAARKLAMMSPDEYFAEATLQSVREDLRQALATNAFGEDGGVPARYVAVLDAIAAVIDNSMDLEAFPAGEVPVATGLLQFLLRTDPSRIISRALADQHDVPEAMAVAVALSGALYGRAMIPVSCRPDLRFERYVDEMLARYLNEVGHGLSLPAPGRLVAETETVGDGLQEEVLKTTDRVLIRQARPPVAAVATAEDEKDTMVHDSGLREHEEPLESTEPGSSDEVFRRLSTSDLASGPEKDVAIRLCRAAGWHSCVMTTLKLERPGAVVTDMPKEEVRIEGFVSSDVRIRVKEFRKQLTTEAWAALPDHVKREAEAALEVS